MVHGQGCKAEHPQKQTTLHGDQKGTESHRQDGRQETLPIVPEDRPRV
jgi:predicted transposase YdaD